MLMRLLCILGYSTLLVSIIVMFFTLIMCVFVLLHALLRLEFFWIMVFLGASILSAFIMIGLFALFIKLVELE